MSGDQRRALRTALRTWWCGVRGHASLLAIGDRRLYVECGVCGWESPGITIDGRGPVSVPALLPVDATLTSGACWGRS